MKTLALVLARGGSKRLPGKNIMEICGKPLLGWTVESALNSPSIDKVLVSTDSPSIQSVALKYGAECPFLRPDYLSSDTATSVDAAIHALDYAEEKWGKFDSLILLEPTSPLRKKDDLENGVQLLRKEFNKADGVVSIGKIQLENPLYCKEIKNGFVSPLDVRAEGKDFYFPYGVFYLVKTLVLREKKAFYTDQMLPYFIERWQNYEVDDMFDFKCVESILQMKMSEVSK
ncbi:cytidylyltransferase domain-containing protein [Bdellovibrio sp. HCB-110]|uniref:acylneuraminate cytidylyltransferase family protein n=1 Tax=Bdellovibrio sp. HCB-110 TaxID=3391182 RepID=UPI0039B44E6A